MQLGIALVDIRRLSRLARYIEDSAPGRHLRGRNDRRQKQARPPPDPAIVGRDVGSLAWRNVQAQRKVSLYRSLPRQFTRPIRYASILDAGVCDNY